MRNFTYVRHLSPKKTFDWIAMNMISMKEWFHYQLNLIIKIVYAHFSGAFVKAYMKFYFIQKFNQYGSAVGDLCSSGGK